jgi:multidrug efflux pump subunit AcrB
MTREPEIGGGGGVIRAFLEGNLAILLILIALAAGAAALLLTPREEEPQIVVPLADVLVSYPGGTAEEVERLVASRLERLLYQIDGVEYVYSMSRPGQAVVTVRFEVGQDREESLIKLYNKIFQNVDRTTPGIAGWVVKPIEIDDVPIVTAALYSDRYDTHALYRMAEEVVARLQRIPDTGAVTIHGGEPRVLHVYLDMERLAAYGLTPLELAGALKVSNAQLEAGGFEQANAAWLVRAGPFLENAAGVRNLMVGLHEGRPVRLRDVARIEDGPAEPVTYTRLGFGPAGRPDPALAARAEYPAVTVAVAKKKGANAVTVARAVRAALEEMRGSVLPDGLGVSVTRDYGETANDKVNGLVKSLFEAVLTVIVLIALAMNWRVGLIVALAIPITYALTLLINHLAGYTINRVTLFALILALGLLVDDPIVAVENIHRHLAMRRLPRLQAIARAMNEVLPPVTLATLAVVAAFLPMFFITGMMGPYMRPMALNVPLAMLASLLVSVAITPWVSSKLLPDHPAAGIAEESADPTTGRTYRIYRALMRPFVSSRRGAAFLLLGMAGLFALSLLLVPLGGVPLKMLPFDNKNEFLVLLDLPEGATLESADAASREVEDYLRTLPEVTDFTATVGAGSPMDFNGLVRHYYLRRGPHLADIRVNLLPRDQREQDSHALVLRIRNDLADLARRRGVTLSLVEVPPGPPVLATVVAELRGGPDRSYADLIAAGRDLVARFREEPGVVDVDVSAEADQAEWFFRVDRDKAGLSGIATEDITRTLALALEGFPAGTLHAPGDQNETPILLRLPRDRRSDPALLRNLLVKGRFGSAVQLGELGRFEPGTREPTIFHKNLERVVYVTAEMAGRGPAYAVLGLQRRLRDRPLAANVAVDWLGEGEWKITVDVFRDLGLAFAAALVAIYALLVYETRSYALPGVIMMSIPLTLIGILPGFWLLNLAVNRPVGGFDNPVFFTATAMIGMITLAGIVVRNGILLVDFIRNARARGAAMAEAVYEAGAVRFRPIFLTASTTMLGTWPITLDPIFSGLAWAIIFGLFVSTAFTLLVIPAAYALLEGGPGKERTP